MAVNNDIIIIQLSQVSREYSRNQIMDLYAGKGSGAIENASRKVIGINGNAKSSQRQVEVFKNSDGDLFKANLEWTPSYRLRRVNADN
jgi:16S rRNA G966 N2-methylase RsmD